MSLFAFALKGVSNKNKQKDEKEITCSSSSSSPPPSTSSTSPYQARALSAEEVTQLKEQNAELREAIAKLQQQMQQKSTSLPPKTAAWAKTGVKGAHLSPSPPISGHPSPSAPAKSAPTYPTLDTSISPSAPSLYPSLLDDDTTASAPPEEGSVSLLNDQQVNDINTFYAQLNMSDDDSFVTDMTVSSDDDFEKAEGQEETFGTASELAKVGVINSKPVCCPSKASVLVTSLAYDEDLEEEEQQIAVVDLENVEWWTLVRNENEEEDTTKEKKEIEVEGEREVCTLDDDGDDGYVLVKENDALNALAEFIVKNMCQHPQARTLTPTQVKAMIEGTMVTLQEPSAARKVWNWGRLAYQTWGWGSTAWALYKEPAMIRLVASGAIKAATWILVLVA